VKHFVLIITLLTLLGCQKGPPEGIVSGTVKLNGELVDGGYALIRMEPVDGATQPNDCAIVNGKYEIKIAPGEKKVQLYWRKGPVEVADTATQGTQPAAPQLFPAKYNDLTELRFTVVEGKQQKDFEITAP
jgi:hypothetical protein